MDWRTWERVVRDFDLTSENVRYRTAVVKIVDLHSVFEGRGDDFELEDILSVDFYHAAVVAAYPDCQGEIEMSPFLAK